MHSIKANESREILWNLPHELDENQKVLANYFTKIYDNCSQLIFKSDSFVEKQRVTGNFFKRRITNFNADGNFLCAASTDILLIWQLCENKIIYVEKSKPTAQYNDVKFLNNNDSSNGLHLAIALSNNHIRQQRILPTADKVTISEIESPVNDNGFKLIACPLEPQTVYCKSSNAKIFHIDFRCSEKSVLATPRLALENIGLGHLKTMAHHPLKAELCLGFSTGKMLLYDSRNFDKPTKILNAKIETAPSSRVFLAECAYNYNGVEIAAFCSNRFVGFFKNNYTENFEFNYFDFNSPNISMSYFGLESEFILRCHHNGSRYIFEKTTGREYIGGCSTILALGTAAHPTLPIIAETQQAGISIKAAVAF